MHGFDADLGFSVGIGYSFVLGQDAECAVHYLGLATPQRTSLAVQGSQRHGNWLMGQKLFLIRIYDNQS